MQNVIGLLAAKIEVGEPLHLHEDITEEAGNVRTVQTLSYSAGSD